MTGLFIFDLDGTLSEYKTGAILPGVTEWFAQKPAGAKIAIATNQGGVGLRYWNEERGLDMGSLPTEDEAINAVYRTLEQLPDGLDSDVFISFRYQSQKGYWSPMPPGKSGDLRYDKRWRKPGAGMIYAAMTLTQVPPDEVLMIGDGDEDSLAAKIAGVAFQWADEFFGRA